MRFCYQPSGEESAYGLSPPALFFFFFCSFFRAAPAARGGSQARGICQRHACNLQHSSGQRHILNPLNKARDQAHNFMVPSQIRFYHPPMGTPPLKISIALKYSLSWVFFEFNIPVLLIYMRLSSFPSTYLLNRLSFSPFAPFVEG